MKQSVSYKEAGVDIDAGNAFVEAIKPLVKATFSPNVIGGIGSFAGAYELPKGFQEPVLMGATDGVGTKLKLLMTGTAPIVTICCSLFGTDTGLLSVSYAIFPATALACNIPSRSAILSINAYIKISLLLRIQQ